MITAYFLEHGLWTVIPHQLQENFADMRDMGFDGVAITFGESDAVYARRAFELQVKLAHEAGLKVHVIPSRVGGRFAGAPLTPSIWVSQHPEHAISNEGWWMPMGCLDASAFVEWICGFVGQILSDYPVDGIIWDEPKGTKGPSNHPATRARYGPHPTEADNHASWRDFFETLTNHCASVRPGIPQAVMNEGAIPESLTSQFARLPAITHHGYDGNLARQSFFHEEPAWHKYRLESVWERTSRECEAAGKESYALVENMLMPAEAMEEYERNFDAYLTNYRPDHLSVYYYAHNNEDPEGVMSITRRLMKKHLVR